MGMGRWRKWRVGGGRVRLLRGNALKMAGEQGEVERIDAG